MRCSVKGHPKSELQHKRKTEQIVGVKTKFDDMVWKQIHSRPVPSGGLEEHYGLARSGRPASFAELERTLRAGDDFTIRWCELLDEFYLFKRVQFFAEPPSDYFDPKIRAWFAGVVEYLCREFELPVPEWTERPEFFLQEYWRKTADTRAPAFSKRNIGYNPRHSLTRL